MLNKARKGLIIQENIPLAQLTTFHIGGPARFFALVGTVEELRGAVEWAEEKGLPILMLGGGSNLLLSDAGWQGLVIRIAFGGWKFEESKIIVGAGVYMIPLALEASRRGLTGLEWAGGLPGTLGGAVRGNAGAFRFDIGQLVRSVEVWRQGEIKKLTRDDCSFGYRTSLFKNDYKDDIILSVEMELAVGDAVESRKQLDDFLVHRQKSQPPLPSAGCIFKNFLITDKPRILKDTDKTQILDRLTQITDIPEEFRKYKKIPAAWLIEQAGMKGAVVGRAQVSPQHANFIVNLGGAKAEDVLALIGQIKEKVYNRFKINLEEEIQII